MARDDLKGRHAAGHGFLRGAARHLEAPALYGYVPRREHAQDFVRFVEEARPREVRCIFPDRMGALEEVGALMLPGPDLASMAWQRRRIGAARFSLCGVTHTLCSKEVLELLADYLTAPIHPWDALICTSRAGRRVVELALDNWAEHLASRLGACAAPRPQLPVIPLGVDADRFSPPDAAERRASLRARYGIAEGDVAALFVGRLSFHAKAHPLPMLVGLQQAAVATGRRVFLLLVGRFPNEGIERGFRAAIRELCPAVRVAIIDGANDALVEQSWFAADFFTSLADNIQETFGLTPIEAMAAGLPAVVADWDGYRDTVVDGETGIRVPTVIPPPGAGQGLIRAYTSGALTYDRYVGSVSLATAVDVPACRAAYQALIEQGDTRRRMGEAARRRARSEYDWRVIIGRYQELWAELADRRRAGTAADRSPRPEHPVFPDPFAMFAHFATTALSPGARLGLAAEDAPALLKRRLSLEMNTYALSNLFTAADCESIVERLAQGPASVGELSGGGAIPQVLACAWLLKMGIVAAAQG